jgi:predicted aspartyl protease
MSHCIEWQHDRRRILLRVIILAPAPSTDLTGFEATALVDSGSTTTGIAPRVAKRLELARRGKRPIGSIQGEGQAERYIFRVGLALPDSSPSFPYLFDDVEGFELKEGFQPDALLGMDILSQCDFTMDRSGRCKLTFG